MKSCFLFIMNELPFPRENSGITLIDYEILSRKNNDCFFDLLILTKQPNGADYIKLECNLRSVFPNVGNIYFHEVSNVKNFINIVLRSFFNFSFYSNPSFLNANFLQKYNSIYLSPMLVRIDVRKIDKPILLNAVDSFSKFNFREWTKKKSIFSFVKYLVYSGYEKYLLRHVTVLNLVSYDDKNFMSAIHNKNCDKLININIGVDCVKFTPNNNSKKNGEKFKLLFVGNFDYQPNADAVKYLCNEIYPELLKRDDGFELYVVGKNPPVEIEENSGLIKTGYVDDVMEYYSMCSAFVCPLRFGAGMKNKVLEAMSCGIPIVSSDVGVEGILGVEDGSNFILSSNLHQYVDAILKLKNDKEFSKSLGGNARKLISEKYKWDSISATYMDVLYSISDK